MELDQLEKRIEWLDKERRNDKKTISDLQKRLAKMEGLLDKSNEYIKEVSGEVTRLNVVLTKVDEYDELMAENRKEIKKELDNFNKQAMRREKEAKKDTNEIVDGLRKDLRVVESTVERHSKLRDEILLRKEVDERQNTLMGDMKNQIEELNSMGMEHMQSIRALQDEQRTEIKKLNDQQGEVSALRKRSDEHRGRLDLISDSQKKIENRLNELLAADQDRRELQNAFAERMERMVADQGKTWRDWSKRFETIEEQSQNLGKSLQNVGEAERAVQKAQQEFEEITEQINRRIHEITEMQRLGEERFRQEWSTFKADDQKRWTNYTLTQEEQRREMSRRLEGLADRATTLEELLQDLQDGLQHMSDQSEKLMQLLMGGLRDWMAENERFESGVR